MARGKNPGRENVMKGRYNMILWHITSGDTCSLAPALFFVFWVVFTINIFLCPLHINTVEHIDWLNLTNNISYLDQFNIKIIAVN